jgi:hypothetical protein
MMSNSQGGVAGVKPMQHLAGGGFINSSIPGRTDRIPTSVEADSYVIPADIISGLGQGSSLAGAHIMDMILKTGPYGSSLASHKTGNDIPRPPIAFKDGENYQFAKGGTSKKTPVVVAGAEYIVRPVDVMRIGGGSMARGHKLLDNFVKNMRAHTIKTLKKLPDPVK